MLYVRQSVDVDQSDFDWQVIVTAVNYCTFPELQNRTDDPAKSFPP